MGPLTTVKGKTYIGIDLGTTYSAMAYLDADGRPVTIPNREGDTITPSVVLFKPDSSVVVGHEARLAALSEPTGAAECVKRDIGEAHFSRQINGKQLAPEAISGLILKKMKQDAERVLGPVAGAVITVPAYFDERRRQATVTAGSIAGLEVLDIINEPTAAALAYALRDFILKEGKPDEELRLVGEKVPAHNALVYDLGGGTFDVTLLSISGNRVVVLATDGDVYLGGLDWDQRIADYAADQFKQQFGADPRDEEVSKQNLIVAAQQAKHNLSRSIATKVRVAHGGKSAAYELTRDQFEQMTADLLYRTENRLSRVIKAAQMQWDHIEQVLAVGGSTRMPQVPAMLERVTGHKTNTSLPPDEAVAHGAAVHAAITLRQTHPSNRKGATNVPMDDTTTQGLPAVGGTGEFDSFEAREDAAAKKAGDSDEMLTSVDRDEMPMFVDGDQDAKEATSSGTAMDMQVDENPNEMTQVLTSIKTTNVNAHSLGVAIKREDGTAINSIVIPRNTPLPASVTKRYGTNVPNQTTVSVHVVEGESRLAEECIHVGTCRVTNLPWGLRKGSTIYVTFSYDNSGRLEVKAVEATSGKSAQTTLHRDGAMDAEQVDKVRQAVERIAVS